MTILTVGYVSGIIAAAIYLAQFVVPNAIVLILVGIVQDTHTASTWSDVQRSLASSLWPTVLRTDGSRSKSLHKGVRAIGWLQIFTAILLAVAAVTTPLGLTDTVAPSRKIRSVPFNYVKDLGPMGYGTPPVNDQGFGRMCGAYYPIPCPGTHTDLEYQQNATQVNITIPNDDYTLKIPRELAELYTSGLKQQSQTVSSYFDIQSRQYTYTRGKVVDHNRPYAVDMYRNLRSMVLDDAVEVVEGLIVDTQRARVGFRNHTVPVGMEYGAEWYEDILFIEPQTECTNLNVSYEFYYNYTDVNSVEHLSLVDNGGFANLNHTYPEVDYLNSQENPELQARAYKAAWLTNVYNMLFMNVTRPHPHAFGYLDSYVGKHLPLPNTSLHVSVEWQKITTDATFLSVIEIDSYDNSTSGNFSFDGLPPLTWNTLYPNPWNVTWYNYSDIAVICQGAGGKDFVTPDKIGVACGLVTAGSRRKDGVTSLVTEPGTWWTEPMYSCASTTKVTIKNVHFKWNATVHNGLAGLEVLSISDKQYNSREEMPLWGVETVPDMYLADLTPFWGFIDPSLQHSENLTTFRADHLYLPGYSELGLSPSPGYQYLPISDMAFAALNSVYASDTGLIGVQDYSGFLDAGMQRRFTDLTGDAAGTAKMVNLIVTDMLANSLIGTRSWNSGDSLPPRLASRDTSSTSPASPSHPLVPIVEYTHQIRYNWLFAIPALMLLVLSLLVLLVSTMFILTRRATPSRIEHFINHLSAGRLFTTYLYPGECDGLAPTKIWIKKVGKKGVRLDRDEHFASAAGDHEVDEKINHDNDDDDQSGTSGYVKPATNAHGQVDEQGLATKDEKKEARVHAVEDHDHRDQKGAPEIIDDNDDRQRRGRKDQGSRERMLMMGHGHV